ncbi:MAG: hypothetical protein DRJ47_10590 [Thermoprotei archaeon]|nr:MAG: hypothetical protein DRJ47_10590 [Thermoprotei archaeon]
MSHWTVAKLRIRNPNLELLKQALQVIAQELGVGQVVENYEVIGWHAKKLCRFAIPMQLPYGNGYGVYIDSNGEVKVVVDDHGAPLSASEFANKLNQYYTALAIARVAPQLGFTIQSIQQLQQGVLIDLVR